MSPIQPEMAIVVRDRQTKRRKTVIYSVGAAVVVLLLVAGFAFANSVSVTRVTNNALALHWNNSAIGISALARAGLVQAVTFSELREEGIVTTGDTEFAIDQAEMSRDELEPLLSTGSTHTSFPALARYVDTVDEVIDALGDRDAAGARTILVGSLEPAYVELSDALEGEQAEIQSAIADNTAAGKAVNGWVVFFVTLAVPGCAVATYFVIARRQIRAVQERVAIELEAEREVSRAKDAFIAGLSHEMRTPLTSIYGFAEILTEGEVRGAEAVAETARIIANESAEMTRMVDDFLIASRLDSVGVEIVKANTRVSDVVEAAITPFERAGLAVGREHSMAVVDTDGARLKHVLINLISNAARHGGPQIRVEVTAGEDTVDIEVVDNGPGVPEERVDALFERFAHDDSAPLLTGTVGLGLAVASRLTDLLGGSLRYQRYGGRSYFVVTLPLEVGETDVDDTPASVADMIRALSS